MKDHIHSLGYLALGSRMKRIADKLYSEVSALYASHGIDFDPGCFPLLTLLDQQPLITISEAAQSLGLSHAAVSQKASWMEKKGLLKLKPSPADKRSKMITLTPKGKALVNQLQPLWYAIRQTQYDLGQGVTHPLLEMLDEFERTLNDASMQQRMKSHLRDYYGERLRIVDYRPELASHFARLNIQWLEEFFSVEPYDQKVLGDPQTYIIDRGGEIYFAELDGEIVGTCALFPEGDEFEFTKMGVEPHLRGMGVGRKMLAYALERATALQAKRVYILTSNSLNPATHLYRSMGFVDIPMNAADKQKYARADVKLEWFPAVTKYDKKMNLFQPHLQAS